MKTSGKCAKSFARTAIAKAKEQAKLSAQVGWKDSGWLKS